MCAACVRACVRACVGACECVYLRMFCKCHFVLRAEQQQSITMLIEAITEVPLRSTICAIFWKTKTKLTKRRFHCRPGAVGSIVRFTEGEHVRSPMTLCEVEIYAINSKTALPCDTRRPHFTPSPQFMYQKTNRVY